MGRIGRSWEMMKSSWGVLKQDKELAILPLISGVVITIVSASFIFGFGLHKNPDALETENLVPAFLFYVVSYTIAFFFQAALVAGAMQRLNGGDPTIGSSLAAAMRRFPALLLWGVIAGTVGLILRAIEERSEIVGKIVAGLLGVAWSLATFFMVPVLVMEEKPVGASFKHSFAIFKKTWGETVAGNLGMGLIFLLALLPVALVCWLLVSAGLVVPAVIVGLLAFIVVMVVSSALQGIYLASVYRYATSGVMAPGFDREMLLGAFREKPAKA